MGGFVRFFSYHNAVPIALSFVTLSFGAALASSEDVRGTVYSSETRTVSVDNTYIANKDLEMYLPRAEITSVTEDDADYFVAYELTTIDVVDAVWQDVVRTQTMRVSKQLLGETTDLGLYVTRQLSELVASELSRLRETQVLERRIVTPRVIATEYSGLVGRFLDPTIEELPGYVPVIAPVEAAIVSQESTGSGNGSTGGAPASLAVTLLGENPARVVRGGEYRDLGVAVHGARGEVVIRAFINDGPERSVGSIVLDTTYDRVWHIRYEANDASGQSASAERYVLVGDAQLLGASAPLTEPQPKPSTDPASSPAGTSSESGAAPPAPPEIPTDSATTTP
jgi:hypothetical protein